MVTLWYKLFSDWLMQNVSKSGIGYLLSSLTSCVWNWHENCIFQTIQICCKPFGSVHCELLYFYLHNYPLTAYYMPYSRHCQYLLKYNIYNYSDIWQNQHRSHGPIFPFARWNITNHISQWYEENITKCIFITFCGKFDLHTIIKSILALLIRNLNWACILQVQFPDVIYLFALFETGAVCHLYFDLEFRKELNPIANGTQMVDTFIKVIFCYVFFNMLSSDLWWSRLLSDR